MSLEDAEQILLRTKVFDVGGMPPKRQVQAYNLLFDQPDAGTRFESVAAHAETAGKLYALCARLALNSPRATALAADLAKEEAALVVWDWDVGSRQTPSQVVALIRQRGLWDEMRRMKVETVRYFEKVG